MINLKLKDFSKIIPIGQEPNLRLSWYWLTDGDLWLTFGNHTLYEYTKEAIEHFGNRQTPYSDYYLVRFLEDFTALFEKVSVSIPDHLYKLTENIQQFWIDTEKWHEIYDTDEDEYSDFYYEEYDKILSWRNERTFDSIHLTGGPTLSFFRNRDKIRIVWETEYTLENGIILWTAKDGSYEMNFLDFINQVKIFGDIFFTEMDKQIELTLAKDWGDIEVDKARLIEEHRERKLAFEKNLSFLEHGAEDKTNWTEIENLYNRMVEEIK